MRSQTLTNSLPMASFSCENLLIMARSAIFLAGLYVWTSLVGCNYTPPSTTASGGAGGGSSSVASSGGGESGGQAGAGGGGMAGAGGMAGGGGMAGAGGQGGIGGGGAGGMPPVTVCDKNDLTLLACFRFENGTSNESGNLSTISEKDLSIGAGIEGSAIDFQVGKMPYLYLWDAPHWDVTDFSVELWYNARSSPTTRMGLFDSQGRYGLFLYPGGELRCISGNTSANQSGMQLNMWTHVACVQSGSALRLYVNGILVADQGGALAPSLFDGINTIGSAAPVADTFDGFIDNVRVWNIPRTAQQICLAAGKQGC
jgi:hypothetical protein